MAKAMVREKLWLEARKPSLVLVEQHAKITTPPRQEVVERVRPRDYRMMASGM